MLNSWIERHASNVDVVIIWKILLIYVSLLRGQKDVNGHVFRSSL